MPTIRDIAKKAGVSVTTVSRVLNNHPYVSKEKRLVVEEVIEQLNYQQNINAVNLSKGSTQLIGVVIPFTNHSYFALLMEGIAKAAVAANYKLVLIQTNYEKEREIEALEMLRYKQIDGLIICSRIAEWDIIECYVKYGPIVVGEDASSKKFVSSVYVDHYKGFMQALDFLYEKGHSKIGYCIGRQRGANSETRARAYADFLALKELEKDDRLVFFDNFQLEDGAKIVNQLLRLKNKPTALLVTSDTVAAGIVTSAREKGFQIPEELAIIGFDNQAIAKMLHITTLEIPLVEMGKKLFELVKVNGENSHKEMKLKLIIRNTV
ncbi:LacI family DNA-binding transcriptional regulator [Saliterribacillus persicus]|uniref:LacI family transcriptional regulator n=1 Tax=Saliterribacillus persicus TaxID=930114 RepID=A0A368XVB7_9BACI|nr:LacI family DNA-binding transcriptional regulator [Saliterribacillus persicus]RCW72030.1 LacI family transcriptional regulator [Saliterribacillus persicus]